MAILVGTSGDDTLDGTSADDTITGGGGNDLIDGVSGTDVVVFSSGAAEYSLGLALSHITVRDTIATGGDDGTDSLIHVQVLRFSDREYTLSTEIRVNTSTTGDQRSPAVAGLAGGGYMVVWQSDGPDGSGQGIYTQRFDDGGLAVGAEYRVNTTTSGNQFDPAAAAMAGGNFVTVWTSQAQDGSLGGIFAQIFTPGGTAVGGEFQVNTVFADEQRDAAVTALADGGFAVCWTSLLQDGSGEGVYIRRYTASGSPVAAPARVNTYQTGDQKAPALAALADGGHLVVWQSALQDGSGFGIYAQRYNSSGVQQAVEFRVNTTLTGNQIAPAVAGLDGGGAVVVWASQNQDGSGYGVYGQLLDATGALTGAEFRINQVTAYDQVSPRVTALGGGGFTVTWESRYQDGSGFGVYARSYDASAVATGAEFRANSTTLGHQMAPSIAALDTGGYALAWLGVGQDGDAGGILSQVYDATGSITGPVLVQGTAGDDTMNLSDAGALQAAGGLGDDIYIINETADLLFEGLNAGTDAVIALLDWTLADNFENLWLFVGNADADGTGNALPNAITGSNGANLLDGGAGADTLTGLAGDDIYVVDDVLDSVSEAGGSGVDTVRSSVSFVLPSTVELLELTGSADINGTGNNSANTLAGNSGANVLSGGANADLLQGGAGNDTLIGGIGTDTLTGGPGDDSYSLTDALDQLAEVAGEGTDTVVSAVDWTLGTAFEILQLSGTADLNGTGSSDDNTLEGNGGANVLSGAAGDDSLSGLGGADTLSGGAGQDTLSGGLGTIVDVFVFDAALSAVTNIDLVVDFGAALDRIQLDDDVFTAFNAAVTTVVAAGQFYKGAGIVAAHDSDDRLIYDTTSGALYYDPDGLGGAAAVQFAVIGATTHANLTAANFVIAV